MLSWSEVVFEYEKPTPTGDSKNSKFASNQIYTIENKTELQEICETILSITLFCMKHKSKDKSEQQQVECTLDFLPGAFWHK